MYNLGNHYFNIFSLAKSIRFEPSLVYFYPFGSTTTDKIEILGTPPDPDLTRSGMPLVTCVPTARTGPLLICYDQEPLIPSYNQPVIDHIKQRCVQVTPSSLNNFKEQTIILLNTELDSDAKDQILADNNLRDCYYFFHAFAASDWFRGCQYLPDLLPITQRSIKKKFITFNRITSSARIYRSLLVNELISHDIIDQGHVSFSKQCPVGGKFSDELITNGPELNVPDTLVHQTIDNILRYPGDFRIDFKEEAFIPNNSFHMSAIPENMESFLHIVTETCYWGRKKHLTEKIFKPIVMKQPFVLVGCAHNLEYLRSYGFKTFDRWWDESYDQIEDDVERMHAIGRLLADICKNDTNQLKGILLEMEETLEYNYRWFFSHDFLNNCWSELVTNLRTAMSK